MSNDLVYQLISMLVAFATDLLIPVMAGVFVLGFILRFVIYFTLRCESNFTKEFEKRVHQFLGGQLREQVQDDGSFHETTESILRKTYYEIFELKQKYRRRKWDHVSVISDRVFLIQDGVARLVRDTLSQTKYLKRDRKVQPRFLNISKFVFSTNPVFNRVFGVFSMSLFNDLLAIMPGLFVIGGIFGTFLGVMAALPELGSMDITNVESTKNVMDYFLLKISFSMSSSIIGILFSVAMTLLNTVLSVDQVYVNLVNTYTASLEFLWNDADNDEVAKLERDNEDRRAFRPHSSAFQSQEVKPFEPFVVQGTQQGVDNQPTKEQVKIYHDPNAEPQKKQGLLSRRAEIKQEKPLETAPALDPQKRLKELQQLISQVYEDSKNGKITREEWIEHHEKLTTEKEQIEAKLVEEAAKPPRKRGEAA